MKEKMPLFAIRDGAAETPCFKTSVGITTWLGVWESRRRPHGDRAAIRRGSIVKLLEQEYHLAPGRLAGILCKRAVEVVFHRYSTTSRTAFRASGPIGRPES